MRCWPNTFKGSITDWIKQTGFTAENTTTVVSRGVTTSIFNRNWSKLSHNLELRIKICIVDDATPPCHVHSACRAEKNTPMLKCCDSTSLSNTAKREHGVTPFLFGSQTMVRKQRGDDLLQGWKFVFTFRVNPFHVLSWSGNNTRELCCI